MNEWEDQLNALFNGDVDEVVVQKDDFLSVRTLLIEKEWLNRIVGEAKHGGITIYRRNDVSKA